MTRRRKMLALAVVSVLVAAGMPASAALQAPDSQEQGPVYFLEGQGNGTPAVATHSAET